MPTGDRLVALSATNTLPVPVEARIGVLAGLVAQSIVDTLPAGLTTQQVQTIANQAAASAASALVGAAPGTLDTLNELATALGNDPNFASSIAASVGAKYTKPGVGIPASDLTTGVQASLVKADASQSAAQVQALVQSAIDGLVAGAPAALDTLNEIAAALAADDTDISAIFTALGTKVNSSTYVAGLAGKADLVDGKVPTAQLPTTTGGTSTVTNPLRYVDLYTNFFGGQNAWVNGQGSAAITSTTTAAAAPGDTILPLASASASLIAGVALILNPGTAVQQIVRVVSTSGNNVTVTPALTAPVASGSTVSSLWTDQAHLTDAGNTAVARLLTYAKNADGSDVLAPTNGQRITLLGNSWFAGQASWGTQISARFPSAVVTNVGVGGNTISHLLARFDTDVPADSKYVVFNEPGVNSVNAALDLSVAAARITDLVRKIHKIGAIPVFLGPPISSQHPEPSKEMARLGAALTSTEVLSAVGRVAEVLNATSLFNTRLGQDALGRTPSGAGNTGLGYRAGMNLTTGSSNTLTGQNAGQALSTGGSNTGTGLDALAQLATGSLNSAFGQGALRANQGSSNTGVGAGAFVAATTGNNNTAVGKDAGFNSSTGSNQTLIGRLAAQATTTARAYVTALGDSATVNGDYATALGARTLAGAAGAVAIGADSGGVGASTSVANEIALGTVNHTTKIAGRLNVAQRTPTGSADAQGQVGDIAFDDNYAYTKTAAGWKRTPALATF